ncbi:hypothetical protein [Capillimicrobium parvum]|uniref:hypothetical protein n=1 Tax=Capillimicrobium parvum TaxID=2884022 RepID=UPI00216AB33C|nr:hypothetical protein [Capillimicrobium parvum]
MEKHINASFLKLNLSQSPTVDEVSRRVKAALVLLSGSKALSTHADGERRTPENPGARPIAAHSPTTYSRSNPGAKRRMTAQPAM